MTGQGSGPKRRLGKRAIVSSAHLVSERAAELSAYEYGLILAANAFDRWMVRGMSAAGYPELGALDVSALQLEQGKAQLDPRRRPGVAHAAHLARGVGPTRRCGVSVGGQPGDPTQVGQGHGVTPRAA